MYCPSCSSEFREGITRCANCEVDLVAEVPDQDPFESEEQMAEMLADKDIEAVVVGAYASVREAQKALATERIPSVIAPEEGQEIEPGVHSRLFLMVAVEDIAGVREYFQNRFQRGMQTEGLMLKEPDSDGGGENTEGMGCPACGTVVPETAEECPECGLFVGAAAEA